MKNTITLRLMTEDYQYGRILADIGNWRVEYWKIGWAVRIFHKCKEGDIGAHPLVNESSGACWACNKPIPTQIRAIALTAALCR